MKDRFGAKNPKSMMCRFHTQTAGSSLTAQEVDNNVIRTTLEALAAVLGGTQSLHTNARDEALALPTEESARLALRTQQVIAYESGVTRAVDPLGGSFYVEELTDRIETEVAEILDRIDALGGATAAIESGFIQNEIARSAYRFQQDVDSGKRIIVGVNRFGSGGKPRDVQGKQPGTHAVDPQAEADQVDSVTRYKQDRDSTGVHSARKRLRDAARRGDNLIPPIIEAVKSQVTLGEISDTLREVFGEYRP